LKISKVEATKEFLEEKKSFTFLPPPMIPPHFPILSAFAIAPLSKSDILIFKESHLCHERKKEKGTKKEEREGEMEREKGSEADAGNCTKRIFQKFSKVFIGMELANAAGAFFYRMEINCWHSGKPETDGSRRTGCPWPDQLEHPRVHL
jgi:hypothetical protein